MKKARFIKLFKAGGAGEGRPAAMMAMPASLWRTPAV
jgi:hypothetical protein